MSKQYVLEVEYRMEGDTGARIQFTSEPRHFPSEPTQDDLNREALRLIQSRGQGKVELLAVKGREVGK